MKKLVFIVLFFILLTVNFNPVPGQEKPQEEVTVIAVEVPVRVLHKGQAVKNLAREDFEIYQNGVKQQITAFEVVSRKISRPKEIPGEELKIPPKKRLFILIFNIFDYNDAVGDGIDYFFKNIFRQGDKIIILTEDRLLNIEMGRGLSGMIFDLKEALKKYKLISTSGTYRTYRDLRVEADRLLSSLRGDGRAASQWDQAILRFYQNYQRIWKDYRRQFITPDIELYRSIIKRVKQIEGEKWALCFQQREMFPKLKNEGPLERKIREKVDTPSDTPTVQAMQRNIRSRQMELLRLFDVSGDIPVEGLKNLFIEANITFHLILLKSFRPLMEKDFELREVSADYENCFRQISSSTGGHTTFSNKVSEALQEATEVEDYYYLLVYSPEEDLSAKKREIEVKVKKRGVDVIYLKHVPEIEAPPIAISNFKAGKKNISFSLVDCKRVKIEKKLTGFAEVKITIFDENSNKVFDEAKILNIIKKDIHISLNFGMLKSGRYFIIIQALDKISNEIDVFSSNIEL